MAEQQNPLIDEIQRLIAEMVNLQSTLQSEPWLHSELSMAQVKTIVALRQRGSARVGMVPTGSGSRPTRPRCCSTTCKAPAWSAGSRITRTAVR
jgi:hypothetical protein